MWYFFSSVGTFIIAMEPSGKFGLWIDTVKLAVFFLPEEAVEAVRLQNTGFAPWDDLGGINAPDTLDGWMAMRGSAL
jgi:hypothetical protein